MEAARKAEREAMMAHSRLHLLKPSCSESDPTRTWAAMLTAASFARRTSRLNEDHP
jgi:hypothetical protein